VEANGEKQKAADSTYFSDNYAKLRGKAVYTYNHAKPTPTLKDLGLDTPAKRPSAALIDIKEGLWYGAQLLA
jgi:hypothetical protein